MFGVVSWQKIQDDCYENNRLWITSSIITRKHLPVLKTCVKSELRRLFRNSVITEIIALKLHSVCLHIFPGTEFKPNSLRGSSYLANAWTRESLGMTRKPSHGYEVLLSSVLRLLVTAYVVPSPPILVTLIVEAISSSLNIGSYKSHTS
jgi:hypothetical protein